jgi:hypothetical protein
MTQLTPSPDEELGLDLDDPYVRAWFQQHASGLRKSAYGQRFLYSILVVVFAVGLAAYVAGYLLKSTTSTEPLGLLADMIYTLGFALWSAAVVVVLIEVIPEAKRRQVRRALEAYEATRRTRRDRWTTTWSSGVAGRVSGLKVVDNDADVVHPQNRPIQYIRLRIYTP